MHVKLVGMIISKKSETEMWLIYLAVYSLKLYN
jgi:hypothetical protein